MATQNSLEWQETLPGQYERAADDIEQFYTSIAKTWEGTGHTFFAITACAGVSIPCLDRSEISNLELKLERAFRYAWRKLRYDHPTLAASVVYDQRTEKCKKVYKTVGSVAEVELWESETFKIIDEGQSGLEFANSDPDFGGVATIFLVKPPLANNKDDTSFRRDIVFRSPHDLIDGIGTLILFNNLFLHASIAFGAEKEALEVNFGDEHKNLSPNFRIAAGIPEVPTEIQAKKFQDAQKAKTAAREGVKVLSLPFDTKTVTPGRSQRFAVCLTAEETANTLRRCKSLRVTPTQAFHAGIALAVRDCQPKGEKARKVRYVSYSLINLRSQCQPPYNSPSHPATVYHSVSATALVVDQTIPSQATELNIEKSLEDFRASLDQVRAFYQGTVIDEDYLAIVPSLWSRATPPYPTTPRAIPPPNQTPSVSLSSMGVIDRIIQPRHGALTIEDPWVMGAEYSTGVGLFLGTFNGAMSLSAGYNEAFHGKQEILDFLDLVKRIVLEGLGNDS